MPHPHLHYRAGFVAHEALAEFRAGLRSGVVSLVFIGLTAYLLMVLANAGYMRDMNAADVPRNAPMLVYLLTPGDSLFLFFAWAWVFAQAVARDRHAQLHELVLAAPVSLPALLGARWLGAWGVALLLGASQVAGFALAPLLEWAGAVPPGSMGPTPWAALAWAWLVYIVPLSAGCGALYLMAALRTRGTAGPFGVAALLCVAWMLALVIIKDGHISPLLGAIVDPSGYGEAERQVHDWTPAEKRSAFIAITPGFAINRLLWCLVPLLWLGWALARVQRERLALEAPAVDWPRKPPAPARHSPQTGQPGGTRWWRALAAEAHWQTTLVLRSRMAWMAGALLVLMCVAGAFFHIVGHAEGPMVPRPELLGPLLLKFSFLIIVFVVAALAGSLARRDERGGFGEIVDAAPMSPALRFAARCMALAVLAFVQVQLVALSGLATTALAAPQALNLWWPLAYQSLVHWPALMEVAVLVLLVHALVRRAGLAHAASMLLAFVLILNHEAALIDYPPYQVGVPVHVALSGAGGWAPWLAPLLAGGAFKAALVLALAALAALLVPRGTDGRWQLRLGEAGARLRGPAGAALALGVAAAVGTGLLLHQRLVDEGGWLPPARERADSALWEQRWLRTTDENICLPSEDGGALPTQPAVEQGAFSVEGGAVWLSVDPQARTVAGEWRLRGVRAPLGWLHAELPEGFALRGARVDGAAVQADTAHDHLALPLGRCGAGGCEVHLSFEVAVRGWPAEGTPPWLSDAGGGAVWLRAADVLPRLGLDAGRLLRVPAERRAAGLAPEPRLPAYRSSVSALGVAPAGDWHWEISVAGTPGPLAGARGATTGALDFAAVQTPRLRTSDIGGLAILHDAVREGTARSVASDVRDMQACVARRTGAALRVDTVVQAPRGMDGTRLAGGVLWLPEQPGWDVADEGVGRTRRRADIAAALAARHVADAAALRQGQGAQWLADGVPGAIGLLCVADTDAPRQVQAWMARSSAETTQALAGSTVPVGGLALAPFGSWTRHYAPLAALDTLRRMDAAGLAALLDEVRRDMSVSHVLVHRFGARKAAWMLGPPLASDLQDRGADGRPGGQRWRWAAGGWQDAGPVGGAWAYGAAHPGQEVLWLDAWPSYERAPTDNLGAAADSLFEMGPKDRRTP